MRVLFCPAHYVYDDSREGSELSWAYNIADRIGSVFSGSVVVTGKSTVGARPYRIIEVTPQETRVNFGLVHAFRFNARYTRAAFRAMREGRFDVVHHVLPFAIGKTYNVAALRHGAEIPFVIGPVQPPVAVRDAEVDPTDFKSYSSERRTGLASLRRSVGHTLDEFASDVLAPFAFSGLSARTVRRAATVVAVNDEAKDLLLGTGVAPSKVAVIPPGIDTSRFHPAKRGRRGASGLNVLAVSQLVKRKNVDVVIRAFAKVAEGAPHARLRIVGEGPERSALASLTHHLGIHERVTFTGFVRHAEVHEKYRRADIFVNASSWEGFATSSLEALASGLPVISTPVGGFADAIEDGRTGYLVTRPDPGELAAALHRLIENPERIADQSVRARELAERRFDWTTAVIPRYLEVYENVIRERRNTTVIGSMTSAA